MTYLRSLRLHYMVCVLFYSTSLMIIGVATYKLLILFLFIFFNLMNSKNGWHLYISPSRILFNIAWGIEIKRLSPAIVTTENDAPITVHGVGFCIEEGWWSDDIPQFTVADYNDDDLNYEVEDLVKEDVSEDCRFVNLMVPANFLRTVESSGSSKIKVNVEHLGDRASSAGIESLNKPAAQPEYIQIGNGVVIGEINPNPSYTNQDIEVSAIGYSSFIDRNKFYFTNKNGGRTLVPLLEEPVNNVARITIPDDAVTGSLTLEVTRVTNTHIPEVVKSEPVDIEIVESYIQIKYDDNGNFDDDQFAIYHNGIEVDKTAVGQRDKVFSYNLAVGQYSLEIKGLVAPDKIATYSVCLSDNVVIVSGDSNGRVETDEQANPSGIFSNPLVIKVNSGDGQNITSCSNVASGVLSRMSALNGD
jgi:hypothetical protein